MRYQKLLLIMCIASACVSNTRQNANIPAVKDVLVWQEGMVAGYKDTSTTPLKGNEYKNFKGLHFFPIDTGYIVNAKFTRTPEEKAFKMPHTNNQTYNYLKYGIVQFGLFSKQYSLGVYKPADTSATGNKDYLVLLFKDETSGNETYGGGRYIDLEIPQGDTITINFNKAYQPFCAYAEGYSCPIPPKENYLPVKVEAGVRF